MDDELRESLDLAMLELGRAIKARHGNDRPGALIHLGNGFDELLGMPPNMFRYMDSRSIARHLHFAQLIRAVARLCHFSAELALDELDHTGTHLFFKRALELHLEANQRGDGEDISEPLAALLEHVATDQLPPRYQRLLNARLSS